MPSRAYDFKCLGCAHKFEAHLGAGWQDSDGKFLPEEFVEYNYCPECGDFIKRIYNFGQFTFKGGLPSNHGRKGVFR